MNNTCYKYMEEPGRKRYTYMYNIYTVAHGNLNKISSSECNLQKKIPKKS